jgi:hypothetical protein
MSSRRAGSLRLDLCDSLIADRFLQMDRCFKRNRLKCGILALKFTVTSQRETVK